jgi:hypothetical protein
MNGQYVNALETLRKKETYGSASDLVLICVLVFLGRIEEAQQEAKRFLTINQHFRVTSATVPYRVTTERWFAALRLAGLPE